MKEGECTYSAACQVKRWFAASFDISTGIRNRIEELIGKGIRIDGLMLLSLLEVCAGRGLVSSVVFANEA